MCFGVADLLDDPGRHWTRAGLGFLRSEVFSALCEVTDCVLTRGWVAGAVSKERKR